MSASRAALSLVPPAATVTERVQITEVKPHPTTNPLVTRFSIDAKRPDAPVAAVQLETINEWIASLCQRAKETGQIVEVQYARKTFRDQLLYVHLERTEQ